MKTIPRNKEPLFKAGTENCVKLERTRRLAEQLEVPASKSSVWVQPSPPLPRLPPKHHCLGSKDLGGLSWNTRDAGHDFWGSLDVSGFQYRTALPSMGSHTGR